MSDIDLDLAGERLAEAVRELIAALEEKPACGPIEERLLSNLRNALEEWDAEA